MEALDIIELYCKRPFRQVLETQAITLKDGFGRLRSNPVSLKSVKARLKSWEHSSSFGSSDWMDVDVNTVEFQSTTIYIEGGMLHHRFDEASVEYYTGYTQIPDPIQKAADMLARNMEGIQGDKYVLMHVLISPEIAELIHPYRLGGEA